MIDGVMVKKLKVIADERGRLMEILRGFKCISPEEAIVVNTPTEAYNYRDPDEFRVHPHENDIPYDWERKDG